MTGNVLRKNRLQNRTALLIGLAAFLLAVSLVFATSRAHKNTASATVAPTSRGPLLIAGPGRVEPYSEDIKIGSELSGRLKSVFFEEGGAIHRDQVLARLENSDYRAQLASASVR